MVTYSSAPGRALAALALLAVLALAGTTPAADDTAALRKKALQLNRLTGTGPINGETLALLEDPAGTKKLLAVAVPMAKEKDQPFNLNATYILARAAHGLKDSAAAETFYRLNADQALKLQSGQQLGQAYSGLIQLLYDNKKFAEVEKICKEFLELNAEESVDRFKPAILRRMILAMAKQGQVDKAVELIDRMIKAQPDNWLNLELKGRVYREASVFDQAAKSYEEVIDKIKNDKRLTKEEQQDFIADLRYSLSGVYVDLKQIDKASEQLKALLEKEPDSPTFNNDLGFIWADNNMNLDEAERMIRKAIDEDRKQRRKANPDLKPAEDKDSGAYLDSLGWVLYKKKKYKEAKENLLKAVEQEEGRHVEIYDHLADVLMALGEKAEALAVWKKAVEVAGPSRREQDRKAEVEKKIKANP
jgi:pentatricopeptide repeat protein